MTARTSLRVALLLGLTLITAALVFSLTHRIAGVPPLGDLLDPADGLWREARTARLPERATLAVSALEAGVEIVRDDRGVPHIFAASDRDAIVALGYVIAQDRLFQLDFIPRAGSGRLSEVFGAGTLETDRFLRRIGLDWGARRNLALIEQEGGIERDLLNWFVSGVNAYLDGLDDADLPIEFRLLGYRPERYTPLHTVRLLQYMAYDLAFSQRDADYNVLQERLGPADFALLYPEDNAISVPIIPEPGGGATRRRSSGDPNRLPSVQATVLSSLHPAMEGFREGKGSNNWAVAGARSTTGAPILAGDMHLGLTLPAIWYEAHLVTPTMNTYGVTIPGAPLPVEAFTDHVAWAFTNTGGDVLDRYRLTLDATGTRYLFEGAWRDLELVPDTLRIRGGDLVVDTLRYAHWGPVQMEGGEAMALQWTAHYPSHTLKALWGMNHATSYAEFETALRDWDTPMQNILFASVDGTIAIRSTGFMPIREDGDGIGVLDGSTSSGVWVGRVPFEDLPHAINPAQGYLSSTNQQPADSTYPYYFGHDWRSVWRSIRINELLRSKSKHSVEDLQRYQADVHAVQRDVFVPLLDTLEDLPPRADSLRRLLEKWDGDTGVDRPEPLVLDELLSSLHRLAWDEPAFAGVRTPGHAQLALLLREHPDSKWLDVQATPEREDGAGLLHRALTATADTLAARYGWGAEHWRWGDHHHLMVRHVTRAEALRPLWRGPFEYPGFDETLSPAESRTTTHSASWRVVVDLSQQPPAGYGVYPGGQSGDPASPFYDLHLPTYLAFEHYRLLKPSSPEELDAAQVSSRMTLIPTR